MIHKFLSRDPSGFIFREGGKLYRSVNHTYKTNYDRLIQSGLYDKLISESLLITHTEFEKNNFNIDCYKIISPLEIPFISYPYEWCFDQLKDAALLTLKIQKLALDMNMSLKDASAYNVQFHHGSAIFIDTLSFEIYNEGLPWIAYKQFCQHFLAPLLLMSHKDLRMHLLLRDFIDGIPLDLTNSLLPFRSKLNLKIFLHITMHSKAQKKYSNKKAGLQKGSFSKTSFYRLIDSLISLVNETKSDIDSSAWVNYYEQNILSDSYLNHKQELIESFINKIKPDCIWDIGSNTGMFSFQAAKHNVKVISFDSDPLTVNKLYLQCKSRKVKNILPLVMDLVNPSSAIGWALSERSSLIDRSSADMIFALALIHHLSIANNIPFDSAASFFSVICKYLVIEFVPKDDPNAQLLLRSREDIFYNYNQTEFEKVFGVYFKIITSEKLSASGRVIYLMETLMKDE